MPHYIVTENSNGTETKHLVNARNQAAALRAITEPRFKVTIATTEQAVKMAQSGVPVVHASAAAAAAPIPEK